MVNTDSPTVIRCKECSKAFDGDRQLHAHLKAHKMSLQDYYYKHFPKKDWYTGEFISFKSKEHYFSRDFNSKLNMRKWLETSPKDIAAEYIRRLLVKRRDEKGIAFAPAQVELRTLMCPPVQFYHEVFGSYEELCKSLQLIPKYSWPRNNQFINKYKGESVIYVDTREQLPLVFKNSAVEIAALSFGDYRFEHNDFTGNCYIERKGLSDFISTLTSGYDRFIKEIERAEKAESNLIVLVEETLTRAQSFKFLDYISKRIKVTPDYLFHNVREIIQKYPHVQFLFVDGRKEAARVIEKIFLSGKAYQEVDLQLGYEMKLL